MSCKKDSTEWNTPVLYLRLIPSFWAGYPPPLYWGSPHPHPYPQLLITGSGRRPHFKKHPWSCLHTGQNGMTKELIGALIHLSMKDGYSNVWSSLPQSLYRARRALAAEGVHERPDGLYDANQFNPTVYSDTLVPYKTFLLLLITSMNKISLLLIYDNDT